MIKCEKKVRVEVYWRPTKSGNGITEHWLVLLADRYGKKWVIQYDESDGVTVTEYNNEPLGYVKGGKCEVTNINDKIRRLIKEEWTPERYNVINHTCQHFVIALTDLPLQTTIGKIVAGTSIGWILGSILGGPVIFLMVIGAGIGLTPRSQIQPS